MMNLTVINLTSNSVPLLCGSADGWIPAGVSLSLPAPVTCGGVTYTSGCVVVGQVDGYLVVPDTPIDDGTFAWVGFAVGFVAVGSVGLVRWLRRCGSPPGPYG